MLKEIRAKKIKRFTKGNSYVPKKSFRGSSIRELIFSHDVRSLPVYRAEDRSSLFFLLSIFQPSVLFSAFQKNVCFSPELWSLSSHNVLARAQPEVFVLFLGAAGHRSRWPCCLFLRQLITREPHRDSVLQKSCLLAPLFPLFCSTYLPLTFPTARLDSWPTSGRKDGLALKKPTINHNLGAWEPLELKEAIYLSWIDGSWG